MSETMGCNTKVIEIGCDQTKWQPTFEELAEEGVDLTDNQYYQANVSEDIKAAVAAANESVMNGDVVVTSALHADTATSQAIIDSVAP